MASKNGKKKVTLAETKSHILRAAIKKPLLGRELAERLDEKYPDHGYGDARAFGRSLAQLVDEGKIVKSGPKSRPQYAKA